MLRDADTALYRAKALGRDRHVIFDHSMHERAVRLPIDTLKIDRSFVARMAREGEEDPAILRSIMSMAQGLGMVVVAEGIEALDQAERLKALGCQYGQGYAFARPLHPRQASTLLETRYRQAHGLLSRS